MPDSIPTKTCTKCGATKPLTGFSKHRTTKDGFDTQCRECKREYHRAWSKANAERLKEYSRHHYRENRQAYLERAQMHKGIKNPLTRRRFPLEPAGWKFCTDCHYLLPLEEYYEWKDGVDGRAHRCKDCSKALRYNLMTRAANARARAADGLPFTACDMLRIYKQQRGRCFYCNAPLRKVFDLDHVIPISKGGGNEAGNVVCACPSCNSLKADLDLQEFRDRHFTST